jgi:hypothetical protein
MPGTPCYFLFFLFQKNALLNNAQSFSNKVTVLNFRLYLGSYMSVTICEFNIPRIG